MTQKEMRDTIDILTSQLRLCVSALVLASDALLDHQPKMVQYFETLIKEIERNIPIKPKACSLKPV
ncbi:MAG: hypothetical protein FWD31_09015 [Planctomycetaceae bacterium]|nr:hypothetical protein [Planctomycetaceae bacterium]